MEEDDNTLYIVLMYGRTESTAPAGTQDRIGSLVLGPFTSLALEYKTTICIEPGQVAMTILGSAGRYVPPEQMAEGLQFFKEHRDWPDLTASIVLTDFIPFGRKTMIGGLTLTHADGATLRFDEHLFYDGFYWSGLMVLSSAVFKSNSSWRENYAEFDQAKAVAPVEA